MHFALVPALSLSAAAGSSGTPTALGASLAQAAIVVAGFVALLGVGAWATKRFLANGMRVRAERRSLAIADVLPLSTKQRVVVVRCYDRTFLLGVGEREVHPIAELDAVVGNEVAALRTAPEERASFLEALSAPQRQALLERARGEVQKREQKRKRELLASIQGVAVRAEAKHKSEKRAARIPKAEAADKAAKERTKRANDALPVRQVVPRPAPATAAPRSKLSGFLA